MADVTFKHPCNIILSGSTGSGKTTITYNIIKNKHLLFSEKPKVVLWYYKQMQSLYRKLRNQNEVNQFIEGAPSSLEDLKQELRKHTKYTPKLIVFDDMMHEVGSILSEAFTVIGHHFNCSILFLSQSLFFGKKEYRTMSLNTKYLLLFKSPRDSSQIMHLARQMNPQDPNVIISAFKDATRHPYSYLLMDFDQQQNDRLRLRTNIFPTKDSPMIVYLPQK